MKWFENWKTGLLLSGFFVRFLVVAALCPTINYAAETVIPVADAGLSRYAGHNPVMLDGTASYDPDNSAPLSYTWQQISGLSVVITDADTATPTISSFVQTDEIQECEFELVVSDGELTSLPDTVKVIIVPAYPLNRVPELRNEFFDPDKPTIVFFGGGDGVTGDSLYAWSPFRDPPWDKTADMDPAWLSKANIIEFPYGYKPDSYTALRYTYNRCGDMIIVYLSSVAPNYEQAIQISGHSTGGLPAMDVGLHLNLTYKDRRYAVNRVTLLDVGNLYWRDPGAEDTTINQFLASSVDGEQCWIDDYWWGGLHVFRNILNVQCPVIGHADVKYWYGASLTYDNMNQFNNGVVAGAYWSVIGPGKNLQLASTGDYTYVFKWPGKLRQAVTIELYDESSYPGRLPEPVTLAGPEDGAFIDANGALFSCEHSENAVGYQLLFGPDPHRVMDYYIVSDTPNPPSEIVSTSPFEPTWWTVRVYDQYGSTIYADPICVDFEVLAPPFIENLTTGRRYASIQRAIDEAQHGHEIVVSPGIYEGDISFQGKNLTLRSADPNDQSIVATTIIKGYSSKSVVTFSGGEDANCVLAGFTITGGKRGIYCSDSSPIITNCTITRNVNASMGAGMYIENVSSPTLVNCTFSDNSASLMGGGIQNMDSIPILINCSFSGNSATYFGGGIYCAGGSPVLTNCILWDDTPEEITIFSGTPVITYSDIQGGFTGEGNIDADPLFADPDNGDYHLKSQSGRWDPNSQSWVQDEVTSPCIDTGDPISPVGLEQLPNGGVINMGAYGGTPEASKSQ